MKLPFETPSGWCGDPKRGASMGRGYDPPDALMGRIHLRYVKFYDGCYDKGGAYWGGPADLYCAWDDVGHQVFERARSRKDAKNKIQAETANLLRFYR